MPQNNLMAGGRSQVRMSICNYNHRWKVRAICACYNSIKIVSFRKQPNISIIVLRHSNSKIKMKKIRITIDLKSHKNQTEIIRLNNSKPLIKMIWYIRILRPLMWNIKSLKVHFAQMNSASLILVKSHNYTPEESMGARNQVFKINTFKIINRQISMVIQNKTKQISIILLRTSLMAQSL